MKDKVLGLIAKYENRIAELQTEHLNKRHILDLAIQQGDEQAVKVYMELCIEITKQIFHAEIVLSEFKSLLEP